MLDAQEGMELEGQGRGLCISFSWLVNERTLIGKLTQMVTPGVSMSPVTLCFATLGYQILLLTCL